MNLFDEISSWPSLHARHKTAPLLPERKQYLASMLKRGVRRKVVRSTAAYLIHIVRLLGMTSLRKVELDEIEAAAREWAAYQGPLRKKLKRPGAPFMFVRVAQSWLCFHGQLATRPPNPFQHSQFGTSEEDQNRFIWVRRNWVQGKFTSPKSKKTRRIDLSRQLRRALLVARDARMLNAYLKGQVNLSDELVFPSEAGSVLDHSNVYSRYFLPAIERAGLRHFRIHDLRHTFASQLLQDGASLAYVRDQLGHSSISVTVDLYGHLVPSANIAWVDRLDRETSPQQNATPAQLDVEDEQEVSLEVIENDGGPGQSRTADLRFRKPLLYPSELRGHRFQTHNLQTAFNEQNSGS